MASIDEIITNLIRLRTFLIQAVDAASQAAVLIRDLDVQLAAIGSAGLIDRFSEVLDLVETATTEASAGLATADEAIRWRRLPKARGTRVTIPEVLAQLNQVKQHIDRTRAMIQAAQAEVDQASTLLHTTLGNIQDKSPYAVAAQTRQHLTEADQAASQVTTKTDEWIAKIQGTAPPGK